MRQLLLTAACVVTSFLCLSGCRKDDKKDEAEPAPAVQPNPRDEFGLTAEEKRWWVEKTARLLHNGQGLADDAEVTRLSQMGYDDVVNELIADERFFDVATDFNFYYLGLKSDNVGYPKPGDLLSAFANVMSVPHALEGAMRLREGGDYLGMLQADSRVFAAPLGPVIDFETGKPAEHPEAIRQEAYQKFEQGIDELVGMVQADPSPIPDSQFCDYFFSAASLDTFELGIPDQFSSAARSFPVIAAIKAHCGEVRVDPEVMVPLLGELKASFRDLVAYMNTFEPAVYFPQTLKDVREIDFKRLNIEDNRPRIAMEWFWNTLPNSSTNYDRKRANYVLKRFFCDDLTPVSVLLPKDHAEGKHAADPGCQACHYKLDPMAGFFRNVGGGGFDFTKFKGETTIFFDDGAQKLLSEYVEAWKAPAGSGRTWDVGYVRSTTHAELNSYAAHPENPEFDDLFTMMQSAPEVKQCLVRRMFEYFVGPDQVVDSGYLEHLTQKFIARTAEQNSTAAFKDTVTSLVTSATYRVKDPVSEECYDRAPDDATPEADRPPCRVAFILQKNCDTCHKGEGAAGGLDLSRWGIQADGKAGFSHKGEDGQPVAPSESLKRIYDRMVSTDPELRMPLNQEISVADRDTLFLWINKTLEAGK